MCSEHDKVAKKERLDIVQNWSRSKILAENSPFNVQVKKKTIVPTPRITK